MAYRIYIADDEKNIRELLKNFLESDGYEVMAFPTGDLLLSTFENEPSDLVILDIMMPGRDGIKCVKELRKFSSVPIILLTAKDDELDYVNGITLGGDDYLNTNLLRENKDRCSLFFYAVSRGDFLFTVRKIIKKLPVILHFKYFIIKVL